MVTGLGMPTSASVQGDYVSVPDLHGRLVILDKSNTIIAVLGHNADPKMRANYNVPQDKWIEGIFSGTHGSSWDKDGNLYVQDWNAAGRIMKLVRVQVDPSEGQEDCKVGRSPHFGRVRRVLEDAPARIGG